MPAKPPVKTPVKSEESVCEVEFVDRKRVEAVRERIPQARTLEALSEIFKALGDTSRLRILAALGVRELCVCDIANLLNSSISAVSHQLRVLRNLKLVKHRKEGKMVYYSLDDECVVSLMREGLKHIEE